MSTKMPAAENNRCPIDFDHNSKQHAENWVEEFEGLRKTCPVGWSDNYGGFWLTTRYKDVLRVAQGIGFTSLKTIDPVTGEGTGGVNLPSTPIMRALPLEADGQEWKNLRGLVNERFGPGAVRKIREQVKEFARLTLDEHIEAGEMELLHDFAGPVPAKVTMYVIGIPQKYIREIADPFHEMVFWPREDPEWPNKVRAMDQVLDIVRETIAEHHEHPKDDLIGQLINSSIDGVPLDDQTILEIVYTVISGGIDTTTNLTAHVVAYLAKNPAERERLRADQMLLPRAIEEFVRYFSPVHALARTCTAESQFGDQTVMPGDRVLMSFAAANRDSEMFEAPNTVKMDRYPNRHIGFGAGIHRCLGSFLARTMFEAMIFEMFERIPDFKVDLEKAKRYPSIGSINGWISMPVTFTPGQKSAALPGS